MTALRLVGLYTFELDLFAAFGGGPGAIGARCLWPARRTAPYTWPRHEESHHRDPGDGIPVPGADRSSAGTSRERAHSKK